MLKLKMMALAVLLSLSSISPALAQSAPLKIVVGFAPGGGVDALARITARHLETTLMRFVVVENKSGAGGTIAADYVANSSPDGNTLLLGDTSLLIAPHVYPKVAYKLPGSFEPVGMVGQAGLAIAVPGNSPAKTLADFLAMAKKAPGKYPFASVGVGSIHHLAGELLELKAGVKLLHVPYRGGSKVNQALAAGEVSMSIASIASAMGLAQAGKIRILAGLSAKRFPALPNIPTVAEAVPGYDVTPSLFLLAPKGAPASALAPVTAALKQVLQEKAVQDAFIVQGSVAQYHDPAWQAGWMHCEEARWVDVINQAHLKFGN
ncbi:Bug family tripartite tricarboxylate transporter substrate binding protein [Paralcaligenes ureilyticus]|uniref:Tripartite-type tricarboxylate transporter receptor subunit TctC n=1 Tax=Paralcaligenes ureilyticus TaxID=627131 RepID=A0A4V2UYH3_9BURK|nr:tripartite tricarboxylate transporter substrate-binding protein [Paralcaligenes ureilyticus]TCT07358.1 tripartite-type tricarboxylate transporter receptor subunit TctC [Paralcaligenes ureilyticus]